jgi:hypothetical protein
MDPWLALGSGLAIGVAVCIIGSAVMAVKETTMPGGKKASGVTPGRRNVYERLKGRFSKSVAAKIANAGKTAAGRSRMARKSARTRKKG